MFKEVEEKQERMIFPKHTRYDFLDLMNDVGAEHQQRYTTPELIEVVCNPHIEQDFNLTFLDRITAPYGADLIFLGVTAQGGSLCVWRDGNDGVSVYSFIKDKSKLSNNHFVKSTNKDYPIELVAVLYDIFQIPFAQLWQILQINKRSKQMTFVSSRGILIKVSYNKEVEAKFSCRFLQRIEIEGLGFGNVLGIKDNRLVALLERDSNIYYIGNFTVSNEDQLIESDFPVLLQENISRLFNMSILQIKSLQKLNPQLFTGEIFHSLFSQKISLPQLARYCLINPSLLAQGIALQAAGYPSGFDYNLLVITLLEIDYPEKGARAYYLLLYEIAEFIYTHPDYFKDDGTLALLLLVVAGIDYDLLKKAVYIKLLSAKAFPSDFSLVNFCVAQPNAFTACFVKLFNVHESFYRILTKKMQAGDFSAGLELTKLRLLAVAAYRKERLEANASVELTLAENTLSELLECAEKNLQANRFRDEELDELQRWIEYYRSLTKTENIAIKFKLLFLLITASGKVVGERELEINLGEIFSQDNQALNYIYNRANDNIIATKLIFCFNKKARINFSEIIPPAILHTLERAENAGDFEASYYLYVLSDQRGATSLTRLVHAANEGFHPAIDELHILAEQKNLPAAQRYLGLLYFEGKAFARDSRKAYSFFSQCCDNYPDVKLLLVDIIVNYLINDYSLDPIELLKTVMQASEQNSEIQAKARSRLQRFAEKKSRYQYAAAFELSKIFFEDSPETSLYYLALCYEDRPHVFCDWLVTQNNERLTKCLKNSDGNLLRSIADFLLKRANEADIKFIMRCDEVREALPGKVKIRFISQNLQFFAQVRRNPALPADPELAATNTMQH